MPIQISSRIIEHYLSYITTMWFDDHDLPPDDVASYRPRIEKMKLAAKKKGDYEYLRLAFEYLLSNQHLSDEVFETIASGRYLYSADEVRNIICYAYQILWPENQIPQLGYYPDIKFIKTGWDIGEWWQQREQINHNEPIRYIDDRT